jgi:uncharacterized SAM-binding protein YcdF (DUF218 family)
MMLVASDYYMYRAVHAFSKVGIDVNPLPYPDARRSMRNPVERWRVFSLLAGGTTGVALYKFKGLEIQEWGSERHKPGSN